MIRMTTPMTPMPITYPGRFGIGFQFAEGTALYHARSYQEAIQLFQKILQADPKFWRDTELLWS